MQKLIFGFSLLISDFLAECLKANKNWQLFYNITHFIIHFHSKNLIHFTNLSSLSNIKNLIQHHKQKTSSLYKFFC